MKTNFLIFLIMIAFSLTAHATEFNEIVPDFSSDKLGELTGYTEFSELVDAITKYDSPVKNNLYDKLCYYFIEEFKSGLGYISVIIAFALLSACVRGMNIKYDKNSDNLLFLITYCIICTFCLGILKNAAETSKRLAEDMDVFVKMSLPAYVGIVTAFNPLKNPANLEGLFLLMLNTVSSFSGRIMINVLFYLGLMYIINYMSNEIHILKLIQLIRQVLFWMLGFILTVFAGLTGLSGINAVAVSYSGIRTVKYTIGHLVPVIGSFLAESSDMVFASAKIFKNAFGTAGIIVIFAICIFPVIKLFITGILLKAVAGISEPFCDIRICNCIGAIGQTIIHMMICLILSSLMFILSFATLLLIGMGG